LLLVAGAAAPPGSSSLARQQVGDGAGCGVGDGGEAATAVAEDLQAQPEAAVLVVVGGEQRHDRG